MATRTVPTLRVRDGVRRAVDDTLAVEEPLEIRIGDGPAARSVSITMRTPGHDEELAVGFLVSEGLLRQRDQLATVRGCGPVRPDGSQNVVRVVFAAGCEPDLARLQRNFYTSSSCGVCGKASLDALALQRPPPPGALRAALSVDRLAAIPDRLRAHQPAFDLTGGLHATGLFAEDGEPLWIREDVGRHNAFDKAVGAAFLAGRLPLDGVIAGVSGRASFELVQKAVMAGVVCLVAVGAPSSLAVELATAHDLTLVGFARDAGFNVYSGAHRLALG